MKVLVNERPVEVEKGISLFALRERMKPDADVVVYNGAPAREDVELVEGDAVVFIRRGEKPDPDELEALLAAQIAVVEGIKLLAGFGRLLTGVLLYYDSESMDFLRVPVARRPDCPVCGDAA